MLSARRRQGGPGIRRGVRTAPVASAFNPPHLSRAILWLDSFEGLSSGEWVDQSPEGNTLTEATNPPSVSTINGKPSARFTAASSQLLGNSAITGLPEDTSVTSFIVMDHANTAYYLETSKNGSTNTGYIIADLGLPELVVRVWDKVAGNSVATTGARVLAPGTMLVVEAVQRHTSFREIMVDGTSLGTNVVARSLAAQTYLRIGARWNNANFFNGHMQAVVVFPEELSAGDRTEVRDWLTARFLP